MDNNNKKNLKNLMFFARGFPGSEAQLFPQALSILCCNIIRTKKSIAFISARVANNSTYLFGNLFGMSNTYSLVLLCLDVHDV